MSIESYRQNETKRVTGPNHPTCFPAALEQISPQHSYKPKIYRNYTEFINWYTSLSVKERDVRVADYEDEVSNLVEPLGGLSSEDVKFSRATTIAGFLRAVRPLLAEDWRVVVDIRSSGRSTITHSVGLLSVGSETDHVTLVSTHIPKSLQGIVDLRHVASRISIPEMSYIAGHHPMNNANITAVPPVY
jgi:hypothetical protein